MSPSTLYMTVVVTDTPTDAYTASPLLPCDSTITDSQRSGKVLRRTNVTASDLLLSRLGEKPAGCSNRVRRAKAIFMGPPREELPSTESLLSQVLVAVRLRNLFSEAVPFQTKSLF